MKIGLLDTCIGNFGQKGFYNTQEIGLGKALAKWAEEVYVYKLVPMSSDYQSEVHEGENGHKLIIQMLSSRSLGSNGLLDLSKLERSLDVLIYFSDTQLTVPKVSRWAKRNGVILIPYLGVIESHSTSRVKKTIIDILFQRNLAIYKKHHCMVKTPKVKEQLACLGVRQISVVPVGLDLSLMNKEHTQIDALALRQKYGYSAEDKVLLFIGRMSEEKQPLRMVELFGQLYSKDLCYKLLMVGTGELQEVVDTEVKKQGLSDYVLRLDRIPNKDIWELYRISDCFVNLNRQEIFGMAILEAMYYGCKVVAWKAPGPSFIIEDGISGCLADSDSGILEAIMERMVVPEKVRQRVLTHFTWENTAKKILDIATGK